MSHNRNTYVAPPTPETPTDQQPSSVQNISNHFSRLFLNHKKTNLSSKTRKTHHYYTNNKPVKQQETIHDDDVKRAIVVSNKIPIKKNQEKIQDEVENNEMIKIPFKKKEGLEDGFVKGYVNMKLKDQEKYGCNEMTKIPIKKIEGLEDDIKGYKTLKLKDEEMNKIPIKKNQEDGGGVNGYVNLKLKDGYDEKTNMAQGYELKKEYLLGTRRSFGSSNSKDDLRDFFACNGVKVVSADMPPYMQINVVDVTRKTYDGLEKFSAKTLALTIKKAFDGVYGPAWHCIVGSSFGSFVTHSVGGFMYFSMDQKLYVLLFKTVVQRAHS